MGAVHVLGGMACLLRHVPPPPPLPPFSAPRLTSNSACFLGTPWHWLQDGHRGAGSLAGLPPEEAVCRGWKQAVCPLQRLHGACMGGVGVGLPRWWWW